LLSWREVEMRLKLKRAASNTLDVYYCDRWSRHLSVCLSLGRLCRMAKRIDVLLGAYSDSWGPKKHCIRWGLHAHSKGEGASMRPLPNYFGHCFLSLGQLLVENVTKHDAGTYLCLANNGVGSKQTKVISVEVRGNTTTACSWLKLSYWSCIVRWCTRNLADANIALVSGAVWRMTSNWNVRQCWMLWTGGTSEHFVWLNRYTYDYKIWRQAKRHPSVV